MRLERIAAAPISWGVCEVPGWGYQLPPDRVLAEMVEAGIVATEFGPDGFLPDDPKDKATALAERGLAAVGGFVPAVLHSRDHDPLPAIRTALAAFTAAGAGTLVLAAATGQDGYDTRPTLDEDGWRTLLGNLDRASETAAAVGVTAVLHPHVGTMVQTADEVDRVLAGSSAGLCLDTGHLMVGGADPVALARKAPQRIGHVHLKDVDAGAAHAVLTGQISYTEAVNGGMYRPLGAGDVDVRAIMTALETSGYAGWYVMEQDTVLNVAPPPGSGPIDDVRASMAHLNEIARDLDGIG